MLGRQRARAFLPHLKVDDAWLAAHLRALASGQPRLSVDAPPPHAPLVDSAWDAAMPRPDS